MSSHPIVLRPEAQSRPLNVVGMQITVLAANAATGSYGITIQEGDEGTGPPPHSHAWDEAFYVLGGAVKFECAGEACICTAGTLVHVPGGTVHAFTFGPGGGRMLEIAGAGAQAAPFFTAIDRELAPGAPDVPRLLQVAERHGVAFVV
jgi:quercetin dioxygenase-like cupin family protein